MAGIAEVEKRQKDERLFVRLTLNIGSYCEY